MIKAWHQENAGFSLAETIVSMAALGAILIGVGFEVNTINSSITTTERLLALDALELNMAEMLSDKETVYYSIAKSSNGALKGCVFSDDKSCANGKFYEISLYLEGQNVPLSGQDVFYDRNANYCGKSCNDLYVRTFIQVSCGNIASCNKPIGLAFGFDVAYGSGKSVVRKGFGEVRLSGLKRFADLNVSCGSNNKILRGIGIFGQALCDNVSSIVYRDDDGKPLKNSLTVKPKDCSQLNADPEKDQFYVGGIDNKGNILCGPRFW